MAEKYTLNVAGLTRELTRYPVNDKLDIAAFIMFSDVELTVKCAEELLKKVTDFDIILTSEAKGIPLAYEMARQSGKNYVVARKSVKVYMTNPVSVNVKSITTKDEQMLHLGDEKAAMIKGKKVLIVDDLLATGGTAKAACNLVKKAGGDVVGALFLLELVALSQHAELDTPIYSLIKC